MLQEFTFKLCRFVLSVGILITVCSSLGAQAFITTWKTDNPGTSANDQITIPTTGGGYNYTVNWGDGNIYMNVTGDTTHTYAMIGTYTVSITGDFPRIYFNGGGDSGKLLTVQGWGSGQWTSMEGAFYGCANLDIETTAAPDLSLVTNMSDMFRGCSSLGTNGANTLSGWDVSTVTDMTRMFWTASAFNQGIVGWNVGNVTSMEELFYAASAFNQNIGAWDVGNVTNMGGMFWSASAFNQNIGSWNTSSLQVMSNMFRDATAFNQDIGAWDVSNVTSTGYTFLNAVSFDQNLGSWDVSSITDMTGMFSGDSLSTVNYDQMLIGWSQLPSVQPGVPFDAGASHYCFGADARDSLMMNAGWVISDGGESCPGLFITTWKTDNPGASADDQVTISIFEEEVLGDYNVYWGDGNLSAHITHGATHTYAVPGTYIISISGDFPGLYMPGSGDENKILTIEQWGAPVWYQAASAFKNCQNLVINAGDAPDLSSSTGNMSRMFEGCVSLTGDLSTWNVSNIQDMSLLFVSCGELIADISTWDVSNVTNMLGMFAGTLLNSDISGWDVSSVTNMSSMFGNTTVNFDISGWDVSGVTNMSSMFNGTTLNSDISGWDVSSVTNMSWMFYGNAMSQDLGSWNVSNVTDMSSMFRSASDYPQNIGNWDVSSVTNMAYMFYGSSISQDLGSWDVSSVTNMSNMFNIASAYPQNIGNWDVSSVTNMSYMFSYSDEINGVYEFTNNLANWDVSSVTDFSSMFLWCRFNNDIGDWNVSSATNLSNMLKFTPFDQDLGGWDISNVSNIEDMLKGSAMSIENYDLTLIGWDTLPSLQPTLTFYLGQSYCLADSARQRIMENFGWTFNDQGQNCFNTFTTTWYTDNPGTSASNQITIPTTGSGYDYVVAWGDGQMDLNVSGDITHTYAVPDTYTVRIIGAFPRIYFNDGGDKLKLLSVRWGDKAWTSMQNAFKGCANMDLTGWIPNFLELTDVSGMFAGCTTLGSSYGGSFEYWDVSNVTNMSGMFQGCTAFDKDLGDWDFSQVVDMTDMFTGATLSTNHYDRLLFAFYQAATIQPGVTFDGGNSKYCIGKSPRDSLIMNSGWMITDAGTDCSDAFVTTWKTDNPGQSGNNQIIGGSIGSCFYNVDWGDGTISSNQCEQLSHTYAVPGTYTVTIVGNFSNLKFEEGQFSGQDPEKLLSIENWGPSPWYNLKFEGCANLQINATNTPDLSNLNNASGMFTGCAALNADLNGWDVSGMTNMHRMFSGASAFNQDISGWNVSNVTDMSEMFSGASAFNQGIAGWNVSNVTDMSDMFSGASAFNQGIAGWNVSNVTNMSDMFEGASAFNQDITGWNVSNVTDMSGMFNGATSFNQDIGGWDIQNVVDMSFMFANGDAFDQNLGGWDVGHVTDLSFMFFNHGLSQANYDSLLIGWSNLDSLQQYINFHGGDSQYCAGDSARQSIIDTYMWAIVDDGQAPTCCPGSTTFSGGTWSNGPPTDLTRAIIESNYDTAIHGDIFACAVQINPGAALTVRAGDFVITFNEIDVLGMLHVETYGVVFAGY